MINLETKIEQLPKTGIEQVGKLHKLGVKTIGDLIFHFPFRYDDYSQIENISKIYQGQTATVAGKITGARTNRTWKRRITVTEILIQDDSGTVRAVWFNQPYLRDSLTVGKQIRLSGKISSDASGLFFSNPAWEMADRKPTHTGRLVPTYPETAGLTSRWLRWQIQMIFKSGFKIADPLPAKIIKKLHLPALEKALKFIHFPGTENEYLIARKRFAFEEMFLVQLKYLQIKSSWKNESSIKIKFDEKLIKNFVSSLPFQLTGAQKKSGWQILRDLEKSRPMNRLLNGDVGSGKTIVAALASLQAAKNKYQTVIMAPTEILARQHFEEFCKLFAGYNITIGLLTSSYKIISKNRNSKLNQNSKFKIQNSNADYQNLSRPQLLKAIQNGSINILIGTHAVIQKDIRFKNLALIIVDEQHRFGVAQRAYLQQKTSEINDGIKNKIPHFLTMTATPIPRTLTMAFFGNLDISLLDEMPKNRKKIITKAVPPQDRIKVYEFVRSEIKKGRQAFVILPLVEDSKAMAEVKAAVSEHKILSETIFPELKVGLLHGRIKPKEKEKIMRNFQDKKINILVSTSVVEVGIDIPNATVMIIENADRFGLSQLHQFRGRVGRGKFQSYCFLFAKQSNQRLKILEKNSDGFKVAEKDLAIRGPGDFLGTRQSGLPDIAMENIANVKLIQISREEAQKLLSSDPRLNRHPILRTVLAKFEEKIHLE